MGSSLDDLDRCPICGADVVDQFGEPPAGVDRLGGYDPLHGLDDEDAVSDIDPGRAQSWERGPRDLACRSGHTAAEIAAAIAAALRDPDRFEG